MTDMTRGAVGHVHNCFTLPLDGSRDDEISHDMREFWELLGGLYVLFDAFDFYVCVLPSKHRAISFLLSMLSA